MLRTAANRAQPRGAAQASGAAYRISLDSCPNCTRSISICCFCTADLNVADEEQSQLISNSQTSSNQMAASMNVLAGSPEIAATTSEADASVALSPNSLCCR